jgi:hypothetical protein
VSRAEGFEKAQAVQASKLESLRREVVGRTGTLDVNGMMFDVKIVDVSLAYGRTRYMVEPMAGGGRGSVWEERVTLGPASRPDPTVMSTASQTTYPDDLNMMEF